MSTKLFKNVKKVTSLFAVFLLFIFVEQGSVYAVDNNQANKYQSNDSIKEMANNFIQRELQDTDSLEVEIKALDNRLKLAACEKPLSAFWPTGMRKSGYASIGISCTGSRPWKVFVSAYIGVVKEIAVLKQAVSRGTVLSSSMVQMRAMDISRLNGHYVTDINSLLGYRFRSANGREKLLQPGMLQASKMIRRGESVTLLAEAGGIQVKTNGKALADGEQGRVIKVRNMKSNRIVEGEVVAKGIVRVR